MLSNSKTAMLPPSKQQTIMISSTPLSTRPASVGKGNSYAMVPSRPPSSSTTVTPSLQPPHQQQQQQLILLNNHNNSKNSRPPPFPHARFVPKRPPNCPPLVTLTVYKENRSKARTLLQTRMDAAVSELQHLGGPSLTPGRDGWVRVQMLEHRVRIWRERAVRFSRTALVATVEQRVGVFAEYRVKRAVKTLLTAHRARNWEEMLGAVENGAPPDYMFEHTGETVLTTFVLFKAHKGIVQLCKLGATVAKPNLDGWAPITLAILDNNLPCVRALIDGGVDVNFLQWFDSDRRENASPLMLSCARGYNAITQHLLLRRAQLQQRNAKGRVPLMFAARFRRLESVRLLLQERVDVDVLDTSGFSSSDWLRSAARERIIKQAQGAPLVDAENEIIQSSNASSTTISIGTLAKGASSNARPMNSQSQELNVADAVSALVGKVELGMVESEIMRILQQTSVAIARRQAEIAARLASGMKQRSGGGAPPSSVMALAKEMGNNSSNRGGVTSVFDQMKTLLAKSGGATGIVSLITGPDQRVQRRAAHFDGMGGNAGLGDAGFENSQWSDTDDEEDEDDYDAGYEFQPIASSTNVHASENEDMYGSRSSSPKQKEINSNSGDSWIIPESKDWDYALYALQKVRRDHLPKPETAAALGRDGGLAMTVKAKVAIDTSSFSGTGRPLSARIVAAATSDSFDWNVGSPTSAAAAAQQGKADGGAKSSGPSASTLSTAARLLAAQGQGKALPAWTAINNPYSSTGSGEIADIITNAITPMAKVIPAHTNLSAYAGVQEKTPPLLTNDGATMNSSGSTAIIAAAAKPKRARGLLDRIGARSSASSSSTALTTLPASSSSSSTSITVKPQKSSIMSMKVEASGRDLLFPAAILAQEFGSTRQLQSALRMYRQQQIEKGMSTGDMMEAARARARAQQMSVTMSGMAGENGDPMVDDADLVSFSALSQPCGACHARQATVRCLNCAQRQCDICCLSIHREPGSRHHRVKPILPKGVVHGALLSNQESKAELLRAQADRVAMTQGYMDRVRRLMRRVRKRTAETKARLAAESARIKALEDAEAQRAATLLLLENINAANNTQTSLVHPAEVSSTTTLSTIAPITTTTLATAITTGTNNINNNKKPVDDIQRQPEPVVGRDLTSLDDPFMRSPKRGQFKRWVEGVVDKPGDTKRRNEAFIRRGAKNGNDEEDARDGPPAHVVAKLAGMFPTAATWMGIKPSQALLTAAPSGVGKPPQNAAMQMKLKQQQGGGGGGGLTYAGGIIAQQLQLMAENEKKVVNSSGNSANGNIAVNPQFPLATPGIVYHSSPPPTSPLTTSIIDSSVDDDDDNNGGSGSGGGGSVILDETRPAASVNSTTILSPSPHLSSIIDQFQRASQAFDESIKRATTMMESSKTNDDEDDDDDDHGRILEHKRGETITKQMNETEDKMKLTADNLSLTSATGTNDTAALPPRRATTLVITTTLAANQHGGAQPKSRRGSLILPNTFVPPELLPGGTALLSNGGALVSMDALLASGNVSKLPSSHGGIRDGTADHESNVDDENDIEGAIKSHSRRGSLISTGGVNASATLEGNSAYPHLQQRRRSSGAVSVTSFHSRSRHPSATEEMLQKIAGSRRSSGFEGNMGSRRNSMLQQQRQQGSRRSSGAANMELAVVEAATAGLESFARGKRRSYLGLEDGEQEGTRGGGGGSGSSSRRQSSAEFILSSSQDAEMQARKNAHRGVLAANRAAETQARELREALEAHREDERKQEEEKGVEEKHIQQQAQHNDDENEDELNRSRLSAMSSVLLMSPLLPSSSSTLLSPSGSASEQRHHPLHSKSLDLSDDDVFVGRDDGSAVKRNLDSPASSSQFDRRAETIRITSANNKAALESTVAAIKADSTLAAKANSNRSNSRRGSFVGSGLSAESGTALAIRRKSSIAMTTSAMVTSGAHALELGASILSSTSLTGEDTGSAGIGIETALMKNMTIHHHHHHQQQQQQQQQQVESKKLRRSSSAAIRAMYEVENDGLGGFNRFAGDEEMIREADVAMRSANAAAKEKRLQAVRASIADLYKDMPELKLAIFYTNEGRFADAAPLFEQAIDLQTQKFASLESTHTHSQSRQDGMENVIPTLVAFAQMRLQEGWVDSSYSLLTRAQSICMEIGLAIGDSRYEHVVMEMARVLEVKGHHQEDTLKNHALCSSPALALLRNYKKELESVCTSAVRATYPDKYSYALNAGKQAIAAAAAADEALRNVTKKLDELQSRAELILMALEDKRILEQDYARQRILDPAFRRASWMADLYHAYRARRGTVLLGETLDAAASESAIAGDGTVMAFQAAEKRGRRRSSLLAAGQLNGPGGETIRTDTAPVILPSLAPPGDKRRRSNGSISATTTTTTTTAIPTIAAGGVPVDEKLAEESNHKKYQMLDIRPTLEELDLVLSEARWARMFHKFATKYGAAPQVDFLLTCQTYKGITHDDTARRNAQFIWTRFMNNSTTLSVIPVSTRVKVESKLRKEGGVGGNIITAAHIFDDAIVDVRDALVTSMLPRFLRGSKAGAKYLEERILSMGLPSWSLAQVAKLCQSDRKSQVKWVQGVVRGWLVRLKRIRERKAAELAAAGAITSTAGVGGTVQKKLGKGFRFRTQDSAGTTATDEDGDMNDSDNRNFPLGAATTATEYGSLPTEMYAGGLPFDPAAMYNNADGIYGYGYAQEAQQSNPAYYGNDNENHGYVFDEASGMYLHLETGWYYDPQSLTYYGPKGEVIQGNGDGSEGNAMVPAMAATGDAESNRGTSAATNDYSYDPNMVYPDGYYSYTAGAAGDGGNGGQYRDFANYNYDDSYQQQQSYGITGSVSTTENNNYNNMNSASFPTSASYDPAKFYAATIGAGIDPSRALRIATDATAGTNNDSSSSHAPGGGSATTKQLDDGVELGTVMSPEKAVMYAQYLARKQERTLWPPDKMRDWAARAVQRVVRGHLTRKDVASTLDIHWMPKLDPSTGYYYYIDLRTGESKWSLPVGLPYSMVTFKILCTTCEASLATTHCFGCDEAHCAACFEKFHKKGSRALHLYATVQIGDEVCIECEARLGTRACAHCDALYCSTCYGPVHAKGGRTHHTWSSSVVPSHRANGENISEEEAEASIMTSFGGGIGAASLAPIAAR